MTRYLTLTLAALALAGCAGPQWEKPPGMTDEQARVKFYECKRDGRAILAHGSQNLLVAVSAAQECLRANGFRST